MCSTLPPVNAVDRVEVNAALVVRKRLIYNSDYFLKIKCVEKNYHCDFDRGNDVSFLYLFPKKE